MRKFRIVLVLVFMSVIAMSQTSDTTQTFVKTTADSIKQKAVEISKTKEYKESNKTRIY